MTTDTTTKPGFALRTRQLLWGLIAALLVLPAVAMQFTSEVNWGPEDFAVAAVLLGGTGLALELARLVLVDPGKRVLAALVIIGALLLVWAELAVGIFD
ncbi:MAG: hypothetical protein ACKOW1_05670 [Novosphingobium sp.]